MENEIIWAMLAHALATVRDNFSQMTWHDDFVPPSAVPNKVMQSGWQGVTWAVESGTTYL